MRKPNYRTKCHAHLPKKGRGAYVGFGEFLRNLTPEQREELFNKVIDGAIERQNKVKGEDAKDDLL